MSTTKDERFIVEFYLAEQESEEGKAFDLYAIGARAGINPKAVDAISKLLIRANFIKKVNGNEAFLTPHGRKLAINLMENT